MPEFRLAHCLGGKPADHRVCLFRRCMRRCWQRTRQSLLACAPECPGRCSLRPCGLLVSPAASRGTATTEHLQAGIALPLCVLPHRQDMRQRVPCAGWVTLSRQVCRMLAWQPGAKGAEEAFVRPVQDLQLVAERCILGGLKAAGVVTGDVEDMVQQRIGALFMPHGGIPFCSFIFRNQVWRKARLPMLRTPHVARRELQMPQPFLCAARRCSAFLARDDRRGHVAASWWHGKGCCVSPRGEVTRDADPELIGSGLV